MSRHPIDPDGADAAIDLAHEPAFGLAHVTVTPAALSVAADGWSQRLEPRAMQVLVVLARSAPAVVGRADLNMRAWNGRVVGDDAINRAVQLLRRVASDAPAPVPFMIETVPRVGYRLIAAEGSGQVEDALPAPALAATIPRPRPTWGRPVIWAGVASALLAAILLWPGSVARDPAPAAWTITASASIDDLPPGGNDVSLSPDGKRLAYRGADARGRNRVFVRASENGGAGTPVSPDGLDARRPAWSPDGAQLAFLGYDAGRPCRLFVLRLGAPDATPAGSCETAREPRLAWSADGQSLLFGDAPGENAVHRIRTVRVGDGHRAVLTSPPGDSMGDDLPMPRGRDLIFQRLFGWADEGWVARDGITGSERLLWRRRGVAGSVAAVLPDGTLAVAWTKAGASGLDLVETNGRARSQPVALGPVTAIAAAGGRLLIETDRGESALARAGDTASTALAAARGRVSAPVLLPGGRLRFPVASAGIARIWESDAAGALRPWGNFVAARIVGLSSSPDGRLTASLVTGDAGREIMVFDERGRPGYRWNPHARSLNPAAWTGDGRRLVAPVLDGAGWRLFELDPFGSAPPRDLGLPGFAVVLADRSALYAVRAGEATGGRELWRLDGGARRLSIDLTLLDIVNWRAVENGVWLPDRSDRDHPRLVLRDAGTGRILRTVAAPGLAGPATGLAADARGPVYVKIARDAPEYSVLTLSRAGS